MDATQGEVIDMRKKIEELNAMLDNCQAIVHQKNKIIDDQYREQQRVHDLADEAFHSCNKTIMKLHERWNALQSADVREEVAEFLWEWQERMSQCGFRNWNELSIGDKISPRNDAEKILDIVLGKQR